MGSPLTLQNSFQGMWQDSPRDGLPAGKLWNTVDFIPEYLGAPARKRGGWTWASTSLASTSYIDALIYAPLSTGAVNLAVGDDQHVYMFNNTFSYSDIGTAFRVAQNPIFHRSTVGGASIATVVIPSASGADTPKSWDGSTFQDLAGTPPQGIYGDVWNDHTLLANGTVSSTLYPSRLWFSPVGNAAGAWDTTNSWVDFSTAIAGVSVLKTAILVHHDRTTERLKGTTPPSATTIGDLTQDQAFDVGCIDARTIAKYNDTVIWADVRGIYQSDGNTLKSLTDAGGMASYWAALTQQLPASGRSSIYVNVKLAAGIYNNTYIISVIGDYPSAGHTIQIDCLAYDLLRGYWYRLGNMRARCFARQGSGVEETYMGLGSQGRVAALSSIIQPSAAVKNDADGTPVQPYMETAYYRGWTHWHRKWVPSMAIQSWRRIYLNYLLTDAASDMPIITISRATDPYTASYTPLSRTYPAVTLSDRKHRDLFFQGNGVMFKIAQTGPSADTRMFGIECEYAPLEPSRLAQ